MLSNLAIIQSNTNQRIFSCGLSYIGRVEDFNPIYLSFACEEVNYCITRNRVYLTALLDQKRKKIHISFLCCLNVYFNILFCLKSFLVKLD